MKIVYVYTNINGFHADSFGDGIAQIMAVTKKAGHDIRQIQIFKKSEYSQLSEIVKDYKPDVIGFTTCEIVSLCRVSIAELCLGSSQNNSTSLFSSNT